nr:RNA-directed DNA polymerase, eukaryota [Tanacetum cinerariifolium]
MVDGVWKEQPNDVKKEFLNHFQEIFDKPIERRVTIDMSYPRSISGEQRDELEREVRIVLNFIKSAKSQANSTRE